MLGKPFQSFISSSGRVPILLGASDPEGSLTEPKIVVWASTAAGLGVWKILPKDIIFPGLEKDLFSPYRGSTCGKLVADSSWDTVIKILLWTTSCASARSCYIWTGAVTIGP